jgi:hypothetical protein
MITGLPKHGRSPGGRRYDLVKSIFKKTVAMRLGEHEWAVFWGFGFVSAQSQGFANLLLRQRPMIGTSRQNPKILALH